MRSKIPAPQRRACVPSSMMNSPPTTSIQWSSHSDQILNNLSATLETGESADFVLMSQGEHFFAHKLVLDMFSDYFASIRQPGVALHEVRPSILKAILQFVYTGSVVIPILDSGDFVAAGKKLRIYPILAAIGDEGNGEGMEDNLKILDRTALLFHQARFMK